MSFRSAFDCLWCGRAWETRSPSDLEGWALLCPECLGKADDNGFIAFRLRAGLADRAHAASGAGPTTAERKAVAPEPVAPEPPPVDVEGRAWAVSLGPRWDDRYTRAGAFARGPVRDLAWQVELDEVTTWLDRLPLRGDIVELAAGTGWWSPLLAGKGELSLYDLDAGVLDVARSRLVAHGLRAHLHVRDAWDDPDRSADGLFTGFWLSLLPDERLDRFLRLARSWLRSGGAFAFVDRGPDRDAEAVGEPAPVDGHVRRVLPDGREVRVPQVVRSPEELSAALARAGFGEVEVSRTARFFVMGSARTQRR